MYTSRRNVLVLTAAVSLGLLPGVVQSEGSETEAQRLSRTHATERYNVAVQGFSIRAGGAMTAVNAPLALVRQQVTDYRHYSEFMPRFQKSQVIRGGSNPEVYLQVSILHGVANVWAVTRFSGPIPDGAGERIEGKMVVDDKGKKQGNVDDLRAVWRLIPIDPDHTILKLELLIVPSFPVPGSIVTDELEFASDQAVSSSRNRAEANCRAVARQNDGAAH
jgi:Polyketide cyclase / dehydrase and lipid transport